MKRIYYLIKGDDSTMLDRFGPFHTEEEATNFQTHHGLAGYVVHRIGD
jgi:hypothetical protein